jgi:hypothetical protein
MQIVTMRPSGVMSVTASNPSFDALQEFWGLGPESYTTGGTGTFDGPPYRAASFQFDWGFSSLDVRMHFMSPPISAFNNRSTFTSTPELRVTSGSITGLTGDGIWPFGPNPITQCSFIISQVVFSGNQLLASQEMRSMLFSITTPNTRNSITVPSFTFPTAVFVPNANENLHIHLMYRILPTIFGPGRVHIGTLTAFTFQFNITAPDPPLRFNISALDRPRPLPPGRPPR